MSHCWHKVPALGLTLGTGNKLIYHLVITAPITRVAPVTVDEPQRECTAATRGLRAVHSREGASPIG